jgi:hypothetical protein
LRQIEALETERERLTTTLKRIEAQEGIARTLRTIHAGDARRMMAGILGNLQAGNPVVLKDALTPMVEKNQASPRFFRRFTNLQNFSRF